MITALVEAAMTFDRPEWLDAAKAAELVVKGAKPLEQSAYKVTVARTIVRRALEELTK